MQQFPNDAMLLSLEGEISDALAQAERTETAFKRALKANPNSTLIARRLARIQSAKGAHSDAVETLRNSLEANPGSAETQYYLAQALINSAPDADQTSAEEILYHLRRAFVPGDKNFRAQFLYARELCIVGKYEEAKPIFAKLYEMKIPFDQKREVRLHLLYRSGGRRRLDGTISTLRPTFGFIQCAAPVLSAYFEIDELKSSPDKITTGMPVFFELGFNLRGPFASNIELVS